MHEDNEPKAPQEQPGPEESGPGLSFVPEPEPEQPEPAPATRRLHPAWIIAACAVAVLLAALALGTLLGGDALPPQPPTAQDAPPAGGTAQTGRVAVNATSAPRPSDAPLQYEETLGVPLERVVRQIDYALIETLLFTGYDPHAMTISEMRLMEHHDERYHFQALRIELESGPDRFITILEKALAKWAPEALLTRHDGGTDFTIAVAGRDTHTLHFVTAAPKAATVDPEAKLAVVIDDVGQALRPARELLELPYPVTLSVLPGTPHGGEAAALARQAGAEVLLHLPMEPKGWPGINPGPGALFTSMTDDELRATVAADLAQVPQAAGVNNHMGSRFTAHAPGMAVVMDELKARGLFFLDSLTAPNSTGTDEARKAGLPVYRRSIFLDNIRDVGAILRQLEKAERVAAVSGQAVAIGHPYPETVAALKKWADARDRDVRVVTVGELEPLK